MQIRSHFLATRKEFVPIAAERAAQARQCWQAGIVFARFNAPQITRTHTDVLGQFFLSQIPPRAQTRHVSSETLSQWADIGLARRHRAMLAKPKKSNRRLYILSRFCVMLGREPLRLPEKRPCGNGTGSLQSARSDRSRTKKELHQNRKTTARLA